MTDDKREKEVPETLIKYYSCNEYSYDALKNNYLWASHPEQFNDPFDCSRTLWKEDQFIKEKLKAIVNQNFWNQFSHMLNNRDDFFFFINYFSGIISLNSCDEKRKEHEDLFWGYYSKQEGFAIEFDRNKLSNQLLTTERSCLEKVNYYEPQEFKKFGIPYNPQKFDDLLIEWMTQKKKIWENENEFRYIFLDCKYHPIYDQGEIGSRKKYYSPSSIMKIYLGLRFFETNLMQIENDAESFIFNHSNSLNPFKYKLLKLLVDSQQYQVYWMFEDDDILLKPRPIKISYYDPFNIIIKIENPNRST